MNYIKNLFIRASSSTETVLNPLTFSELRCRYEKTGKWTFAPTATDGRLPCYQFFALGIRDSCWTDLVIYGNQSARSLYVYIIFVDYFTEN